MYQSGSNQDDSEKNKSEEIKSADIKLTQDQITGSKVIAAESALDEFSVKLSKVWEGCLDSIKNDIDAQVYSAYFRRVKFLKYDLYNVIYISFLSLL